MKKLLSLILLSVLFVSGAASADPVHATAPGVNDLGNGVYIPVCDMFAAINVSTSGPTQIIPIPSGGAQIHICHFDWIANGATTVQFEYGTGTNCGTGSGYTNMPAAYPATAETGVSAGAGIGQIFAVPVANALCINNLNAVGVEGLIAYTVY